MEGEENEEDDEETLVDWLFQESSFVFTSFREVNGTSSFWYIDSWGNCVFVCLRNSAYCALGVGTKGSLKSFSLKELWYCKGGTPL